MMITGNVGGIATSTRTMSVSTFTSHQCHLKGLSPLTSERMYMQWCDQPTRPAGSEDLRARDRISKGEVT